jgi:hypothetical protein
MNRRIGRRAFLGGAAVALGLPFLPSLMQRDAVRGASAATTGPKRFLIYYIPNGVYALDWTPKTTGPNYTFSPTLAGLAPVRDDILVLSGLTNAPGVLIFPRRRGRSDYAASAATCARNSNSMGLT